ncbi:MAG: response regulator transcription factor [Phycisphaeraceae bacterium]|nr:response regulator transcription factor [Phycisphaerae bacterium]MBX3393578.1 response regulator transcription factor [Phycisphaeraceae bacterium]HRJ49183.1 response regulator transcription factor [Phycisphaerales bacterium]
MSLARVLVVEDDAAVRRGVVDALNFAGYEVIEAADGAAGLELATTRTVDIVLLDILMPRLDGLEVLSGIRRVTPGLPVILLTARGLEEDRVRGLQAGADDYIVKPFGPREMIARVEAVLRRSAERPARVTRILVAGRAIDLARREITLGDSSRRTIPDLEARLLEYLASNPGRAVSREELLNRVWKLDARGLQTRTVDMAVARLRELLDDDPASPAVIVTVRSRGYMLAADARADDGRGGSNPS